MGQPAFTLAAADRAKAFHIKMIGDFGGNTYVRTATEIVAIAGTALARPPDPETKQALRHVVCEAWCYHGSGDEEPVLQVDHSALGPGPHRRDDPPGQQPRKPLGGLLLGAPSPAAQLLGGQPDSGGLI